MFQQRNVSPSLMTYLLSVAVDEQVKGNSSHHVNEEPAFEVVDSDTHRVAHHLIIRVHICCPVKRVQIREKLLTLTAAFYLF